MFKCVRVLTIVFSMVPYVRIVQDTVNYFAVFCCNLQVDSSGIVGQTLNMSIYYFLIMLLLLCHI